jgi:predicted double-glycine peptidase
MKPTLASVLFTVAACTGVQAGPMDLVGTGSGRYALKVTSLKEARFRTTVRQQYDFSCGSAALATLLTYHYGNKVSEQAVFEAMYAQGDQQKIQREGFSLLDMKRYLRDQGYQADGFELPLDKLVESGLPAIVLIAEKNYHHFVVVKGMRNGRVLVGDPSSGARALSRETFESVWVNRLLFVVHNRQSQALFNADAEWQYAPRAPLASGLQNDALAIQALGKLGPTDF